MSRNINPVPQFLDESGDPVADGSMFYFESGTTTQKVTYADAAQTIANTHPVLLDGSGRLPNVFFSGAAKQILVSSEGVQQWERDPVGGDAASSFGADWVSSTTYALGDVVVGSDGEFYSSIITNNAGNDPTTSLSSWEQLQFGRSWNANVTYSDIDSAYGSDGLLYRSLVTSNLGNDPTTDVENWRSGASSQINFYTDSGLANAYVLSVAAGGSRPKALIDGLPVEFVALNTNTGASTVNVAGFGAKDIKLFDGTAAAAGVISGRTQCVFDLVNDRFELLPPTLPGDILQTVSVIDGNFSTGTATIPFDDTIPQNTEGNEFLTLSIVPKSSNSTLIVTAAVNLGHSTSADLTAALFVNSQANAIAANGADLGAGSTQVTTISLSSEIANPDLTTKTIKIRAGNTGAGTTYFNGSNGARRYGGVYYSKLQIVEVQA